MCVCVLCVNSRQDMNFIICFISFHIWSSKFIIFQSYQSIPKKIGCRKKNENGQKTTMMMMMKININILANILLWKKIPIQVLILKIFFLFIFSFESNRMNGRQLKFVVFDHHHFIFIITRRKKIQSSSLIFTTTTKN